MSACVSWFEEGRKMTDEQLGIAAESTPHGQRYWYRCRYCDRVFASPVIVATPYCGGCPDDDTESVED